MYTINTTERHDITEIVLKVALNTIKQTNISERLLDICQLFTDACNCSYNILSYT